MMHKDKGRILRTAVLVIGSVASIVAIGLYGLWLWLALSALVLGSGGFRRWVASQEGYLRRTARLPLWRDGSRGRLFASLTMYLLPLSLLFGLLMLALIQSGRTYAIFALIGLAGLLFLHVRFVYGDKGLGVKAIGDSVMGSLRFAGESKQLTRVVLLGAVFPLLIGLLTMSMSRLTAVDEVAAQEVPAAEVVVQGEPSKEELAAKRSGFTAGRSGFVAIDYEENSEGSAETADVADTATAQATDTPVPAETPLPTATDAPAATDAPTETAVPADTREPTATSTVKPTATEVVIEGELATVVSIVDGDTIRVELDGVVEPVRYIGIDTPESDELCGLEATWANGRLVSGETVRLVRDVNNRDKYDRLLRYVYVGDTFVNAELVKEGWAIPKRYPPDTAMAAVLEAAQTGGPAPNCQAVAAAVVVAPTATAVPVVPTAVPVVPTAVPEVPTEPPAPPPAEPAPAQNCTPGYDPCIPPGDDVDCAGGQGNGPRYVQGPVTVSGSDPYRLDSDNDGIGCEG